MRYIPLLLNHLHSCFLAAPINPQPEARAPVSIPSSVPVVPQIPTPEALAAVAQLFKSSHAQEVSIMLP